MLLFMLLERMFRYTVGPMLLPYLLTKARLIVHELYNLDHHGTGQLSPNPHCGNIEELERISSRELHI